MVQHVINDDAHHATSVETHAQRNAADMRRLDDASIGDLDWDRRTLSQRIEPRTISAAA